LSISKPQPAIFIVGPSSANHCIHVEVTAISGQIPSMQMATEAPRRLPVGLVLAATIVAAWLALHVYGVFAFDLGADSPWFTVTMVLALCWLYVGLFIVAHDCMHGSLAPGHQRLNAWIGQLCVALYAGFAYRDLQTKHMLHHRQPGTPEDPDFADPQPAGFFAWYWQFMSEYLNWKQFAIMSGQAIVYLLLGASYPNMMIFWVLPALLSTLQLFYFGTYLPHRPDATPFADRHHARSNAYPAWLSLLTCFHFGYHHEHHLRPGEPWWRLPAVRRARSGSLLHDAQGPEK
jgi:beta-carotene ketolase (CrtW type)